MDTHQKRKANSWRSALAAAALVSVSQIQAAPGLLDPVPLFVKSSAEPNIFFMNDDSGSMTWEMLTPTGTFSGFACTTPECGVPVPTETSNGGPTPLWRGRFSGFNQAYYDPTQTYSPWQGQDDAGIAYADAVPTAVRQNPFRATGPT